MLHATLIPHTPCSASFIQTTFLLSFCPEEPCQKDICFCSLQNVNRAHRISPHWLWAAVVAPKLLPACLPAVKLIFDKPCTRLFGELQQTSSSTSCLVFGGFCCCYRFVLSSQLSLCSLPPLFFSPPPLSLCCTKKCILRTLTQKLWPDVMGLFSRKIEV